MLYLHLSSLQNKIGACGSLVKTDCTLAECEDNDCKDDDCEVDAKRETRICIRTSHMILSLTKIHYYFST